MPRLHVLGNKVEVSPLSVPGDWLEALSLGNLVKDAEYLYGFIDSNVVKRNDQCTAALNTLHW